MGGVRRAASRDDEHWSNESPVLIAEVLSPSTRHEDIFHKSDDYRLAGVERYWIVDREAGELTARCNAGEGWDTILELDEKTPRGEVTVADLGTVALDLDQLLS
jgi:Uma2 family endonuclease